MYSETKGKQLVMKVGKTCTGFQKGNLRQLPHGKPGLRNAYTFLPRAQDIGFIGQISWRAIRRTSPKKLRKGVSVVKAKTTLKNTLSGRVHEVKMARVVGICRAATRISLLKSQRLSTSYGRIPSSPKSWKSVPKHIFG